MFRKMTLVFAAVIALATWASAKPGTWGKEQPGNETQTLQPGVRFHQWFNAFSAAYEQRDGEKMDELLKQFEGAKAEFPKAPRMEKWMGNVKQAYDQQDIHKMGRLLDNAQRLREHFRQNRPGRMERNDDRFGPQDRPMHRHEGNFRNREFGPRRDIDAQAYRQNRGRDFDRPNRMRPSQAPQDERDFEGRTPRMSARRPMDSGMRPEGFTGGRFREQMGRDDMGPRMRNRAQRPQFDNDMPADRMRPSHRSFEDSRRPNDYAAPFGYRNFDRHGYGPRMQRQQYRPFHDDVTKNFWD